LEGVLQENRLIERWCYDRDKRQCVALLGFQSLSFGFQFCRFEPSQTLQPQFRSNWCIRFKGM
jgi:hypothetical protein